VITVGGSQVTRSPFEISLIIWTSAHVHAEDSPGWDTTRPETMSTYNLDHPWENGRFAANSDPAYLQDSGGDRNRF